MSFIRLPLLAATLLGALSALYAQKSPFEINGKLQVCGLNLCNQYGNPIQLRGISTHGLQWYPWGDCLNNESLEVLKTEWGADILRVSMYMQEGGWTTNKPKFTAMVDQAIEAATAKGLYVIVDFHQLSPGDPMSNLANAKEYFEHMVPKHSAKGNLLYEICNEPSGVSWARIKEYADQIMPVIRKHDPKSPILVGTMAWSSLGVSGQGPWSNILSAPIVDPNFMYVFHFYAASHGGSYREAVKAASEKIPLFVTEFGTQQATGGGGNDFASSQAWMDLMAEKKISWVNWNFSDDGLSGAVLKGGTCPGGPFTGSSLKEAGQWIFDKMKTPDNFSTTPNSTVLGRAASGGRLSDAVRITGAPGGFLAAVDLAGEYELEITDAAGRTHMRARGHGHTVHAIEGASDGIRFLRVRQDGETAVRALAP